MVIDFIFTSQSQHESITALMLLLNANVDYSHHVSIVSVVSANTEVEDVSLDSTNDEFIENVSYSSMS